jgi:hypothetical protein
LSDFSRLWSGCGGERDATPLGWQGANIGGHGFWTVGAPRRIRVAVKNSSNTDLITLAEDAASMLRAEIPRFVIAEIIAKPAKLGVKASRFRTVYGKNTSGDLLQGANLTPKMMRAHLASPVANRPHAANGVVADVHIWKR